MIEYAPQGGTNHIHTIIRDPSNDYGARLMKAGELTHGELTKFTDVSGNVTTVSYDTAGNVSVIQDKLGYTTFSYDSAEQQTVQWNALGRITKTRVWMAADRSGLGKPADCDPPAGCSPFLWMFRLRTGSTTEVGRSDIEPEGEPTRVQVQKPH